LRDLAPRDRLQRIVNRHDFSTTSDKKADLGVFLRDAQRNYI